MTRTTGNLSELAPSFEKQRGDARAGQHDKASEAERAAAKNAFGSLVKKSDDGSGVAGKPGLGPENAKSPSNAGTSHETVQGRDGGASQFAKGVAKPVLGQPTTGLQVALKLAQSAADGNPEEADGQASGSGTVSLSNHNETDTSSAKKNARLADGIGVQSMPRATDIGREAGNERDRERDAIAAAKEIPVEESKLRDRILDNGAAARLAARPLDGNGKIWSGGDASGDLQHTIDAELNTSAADDRIDRTDIPELSDGVVSAQPDAISLLSQPSQALNQVAASLQKVTGQSLPLADMGAASARSKRVEPNVRLASEAVATGRATSDLSALPTSSALPELRARLATESATAQRALSLDEQALELDSNIEAEAPDWPVRVVKQEGHLAMAPDARVGAGTVIGQLVQSLASTDGLPKIGSELKLLASRGSTTLTPEPLRVLHIQLQPRELGDLAVRIALRGDKVEVRVQTARQATANLLMSDQRLLVEALQQKNLDVDSVTIQVVEQDKNSTGQSASMSNPGQGRSGQSESCLSGSQGQASRQNGNESGQSEASDVERRNQQQDTHSLDENGRRRGVYI